MRIGATQDWRADVITLGECSEVLPSSSDGSFAFRSSLHGERTLSFLLDHADAVNRKTARLESIQRSGASLRVPLLAFTHGECVVPGSHEASPKPFYTLGGGGGAICSSA